MSGWEVEAGDERPRVFRFARAEGETLAKMRDNFRAHPLYQAGNALLAWVNEGDLHAAMFRAPAPAGDDAGLVERLLEFEGSDDLGNGDFKVTADAAAAITRLTDQRAELCRDLLSAEQQAQDAFAAGKATGIEEAAKVAKTGWLSADYDVVGIADADVCIKLCEHIEAAIRNLGGSTDE